MQTSQSDKITSYCYENCDLLMVTNHVQSLVILRQRKLNHGGLSQKLRSTQFS